MTMNQILGKTYKTIQEKGQYRSVFKLKICKKFKEFFSMFWSFYLVFFMLQYAMDVE